MFRGILIVFAFSLSSFADTHPVKRLYPALSVMAGIGCKGVLQRDTALNTFCDKLILSGMFATGDEIAGAIGQLTNSTEVGHASSAVILFVTGFDHARNPEAIAQYSRASGANQVGHVYRDLIKGNPSEVQVDYKVLGATTVLVPWLATYAIVDPARFAAKAGVGFSFTSAYMLRETLLEMMKSHAVGMPELKVAVVFSSIGATGMALQTPFGFPYFISMAIFDAGAFSFADEAVKTAQEYGLTAWTSKFLCAFVGAVLYVPNAKTATSRITSGFATAFFYPAAFSITYEAANQLMSLVVEKAQELVESKNDL